MPAPCVTVMSLRCRSKTALSRMEALSLYSARVDLDAARQQNRTAFLKRSCLPTASLSQQLERGLTDALQPDDIDQVLLGYLYSGAAFS
jgi:hypothetical protein